jgi:tRNA G46 methylase TrmB
MLFSEFNRVLKKDGVLIFSTDHPVAMSMLFPENNYFETELITEEWTSYGIEMHSFKRPLSEIFRTLKECDFRIDEVLEPLPTEECKERFPDSYEKLSRQPWFICFRVTKEK